MKLSLFLYFGYLSQFGLRHPRKRSLAEVEVQAIEARQGQVCASGSVTWEVRGSGRTLNEHFRVKCPVPSLQKTPRQVRPQVVTEPLE